MFRENQNTSGIFQSCPGLKRTGAVLAFVVFVILSPVVSRARAESPGPRCKLASDAMEVASSIRGLDILQKVPCLIKSRADVERYLREAITEKVSQSRLESEEHVYKVLGLIPEDYSYLEGVLRLYTEQLGGYYDPDKDYYGLAEWIPDSFQMVIAVHELTHALQDQHFKLDRFMDHARLTGDELMARSALAEGDATIVMLDYTRARQALGRVAELESVAPLMMQNIGGAMFSSSLRTAPAALQALLLFPYVSGLNFTHSLLRHGGFERVDEAFQNPPVSTKEILHPEVYLKRISQNAKNPSVPAGASAKRPKSGLYSDTLGEFVINVLLSTWIPQSEAGAGSTGWDYDQVCYRPEGRPDIDVEWYTAWESPREAEEFFRFYKSTLNKRFPGAKGNSNTDDLFFVEHTAFGSFSLTKRDNTVVLEVRKP